MEVGCLEAEVIYLVLIGMKHFCFLKAKEKLESL